MFPIRRLMAMPLLLAASVFLVTAVPLAHARAADVVKAPTRGAVHLVSPENGATVKGPVTFKFRAAKVKIAPAGTMETGTGHFHLIVDALPTPKGEVIPSDAQHIHYGKAQMQATLDLKPGLHTVTLLLADGAHHSYGPRFADTIVIDVKK